MSFSLLLASVDSSQLFSGKHSFPIRDHRGRDSVNELQFIEPSNIKVQARHSKEYTILDVSPRVINNDDMVTVTYQSDAPSSYDWIGAYSPADVDITTTVPVKFAWCDEDANYFDEKISRVTFNLTNLRADVKFYYFTNSLTYPIEVGESNQLVSFGNINEQLRPRMVPTGDPDVFSLLWSSATSTQPVVYWGSSSGEYTNSASASTSTIERSEMCGSPANTIGWRDLGLIHTANLKGMLSTHGNKIYYKFGDVDSDTWSREYVFFVPPAAGEQPVGRPTTVVLFDDLGRGSNDMAYTWTEYGRPAYNTTLAVGAEVAEGNIDAVYHGGDISYAWGYAAVWDFFLDMLTPMSASVLYMTTVGNHETDWPDSPSYYTGTDSGGECGVMSTRLLPMPQPATTNEPWWSYDVGLIHFVGMSTEHDFTIGSKQNMWLESDLASVDRGKTPWVVFGGHRPMYINSDYGESDSSDLVVMQNLIEHVEPMLMKYKANFAFWGHNHVVERQSAVYNSTVVQASIPGLDLNGNEAAIHEDPQATVHVVIGTGGAAFTKSDQTPGPAWCEKVFYQYGYSKVTAVNATYLEWEWIDSGDNLVYDRMVITQSDPKSLWI